MCPYGMIAGEVNFYVGEISACAEFSGRCSTDAMSLEPGSPFLLFVN
jgi:hypothetical protein